jgi:hypothetical protein
MDKQKTIEAFRVGKEDMGTVLLDQFSDYCGNIAAGNHMMLIYKKT